jgi:hypothetical protein
LTVAPRSPGGEEERAAPEADERFVDPLSGGTLEVSSHPRTGERAYVRRGEVKDVGGAAAVTKLILTIYIMHMLRQNRLRQR